MALAATKSAHEAHVKAAGGCTERVYELDVPSPLLDDDEIIGRVMVMFCVLCGFPTGHICLHIEKEWRGRVLSCKVCNADGT